MPTCVSTSSRHGILEIDKTSTSAARQRHARVVRGVVGDGLRVDIQRRGKVLGDERAVAVYLQLSSTGCVLGLHGGGSRLAFLVPARATQTMVSDLHKHGAR